MSDWISAGVTGLFDLLGGGLNAIYNASAAKKNYAYNKKLQDDSQEHQVYMYQNQNQWRVNDLRAAGLNPILATHAASSMPSASASHSAISSPANFDFSRSAKSIERALFEKGKKENDLLDAQISSAKSVADSNKALAEKYAAEAFNMDLNSAFEYSRDMLNLRKRELYNRGTPDLSRGFGIFKDEVDKFNNYQPYHILDKGESVWNIKHSPRRNGKNLFYFEN